MFGHETFGFEPDVVIMAKGLSSGYMPIGAVAVSETILKDFFDLGGEPPAAWHAFNHDGQSMAQHSVSGNSSPQGPTSVDLEA